jgi:hypothetical protein
MVGVIKLAFKERILRILTGLKWLRNVQWQAFVVIVANFLICNR